MKIICLLTGGPMLKISVQKKIIEFEMHPYCGPTLLNKKGDPIDVYKHPKSFLEAVSLWANQGNRMEDGLCRWDYEQKKILEQIGKNHFVLKGLKPAVKGE